MVDIRIARVTDARGIAEVHIRAWQEAYADLLPPEYLSSLSISQREKQWSDTIESVNAFSTDKMVLVAEDGRDQKVVGFIHVGGVRDLDGIHDSEIYALYVQESHHRAGVGRNLNLHGLEWLQAKSYQRTKLWVIDGTSSEDFCAKMGATLTEQAEDVWIGGMKLVKVAYSFDLERWGRAKELQRARWIVGLGCLPSPLVAEGVTQILGIRQHVLGFRTETFNIITTVPAMLSLPLIWLALTFLASPRSALGVDSYKYWRQGGYMTLVMTYLSQILFRTNLVNQYTHPDIMSYFLPGVLLVSWVILALYAYLIRLLFRRSLYE